MNAPAKRMSMRGVRTFCVAARHGSFRVAAEELYITASAVSHQVKKLEDELGVRLFERRGRDRDVTVTWLDRFREKYSGLRGSMLVMRFPLSV